MPRLARRQKKGRRLSNPLGEQLLTPFALSDGSPEKLKVMRGVPGATVEVFG